MTGYRLSPRSHGRSIFKNCINCGDLMEKPPAFSYAQWETKRFCSPRCDESKRSSAERLKARLVAVGDCLEWTGCRDEKGYGQMSVSNRRVKTHRVAYELEYGPIPDHMLVCHTCDNPPCCNPDHLFLGTPAENTADMTFWLTCPRKRGGRCGLVTQVAVSARIVSPRNSKVTRNIVRRVLSQGR